MFVEFPNRGTPLFKCSPFGYKIRKHACKHITHPHQITLKHPKEHCGIYTKKASRLRSFLRFLADSNRRTRFCRPLTKPLIQGTLWVCDCKGITIFRILQHLCHFFSFRKAILPNNIHTYRLLDYRIALFLPIASLSQRLPRPLLCR